MRRSPGLHARRGAAGGPRGDRRGAVDPLGQARRHRDGVPERVVGGGRGGWRGSLVHPFPLRGPRTRGRRAGAQARQPGGDGVGAGACRAGGDPARTMGRVRAVRHGAPAVDLGVPRRGDRDASRRPPLGRGPAAAAPRGPRRGGRVGVRPPHRRPHVGHPRRLDDHRLRTGTTPAHTLERARCARPLGSDDRAASPRRGWRGGLPAHRGGHGRHPHPVPLDGRALAPPPLPRSRRARRRGRHRRLRLHRAGPGVSLRPGSPALTPILDPAHPSGRRRGARRHPHDRARRASPPRRRARRGRRGGAAAPGHHRRRVDRRPARHRRPGHSPRGRPPHRGGAPADGAHRRAVAQAPGRPGRRIGPFSAHGALGRAGRALARRARDPADHRDRRRAGRRDRAAHTAGPVAARGRRSARLRRQRRRPYPRDPVPARAGGAPPRGGGPHPPGRGSRRRARLGPEGRLGRGGHRAGDQHRPGGADGRPRGGAPGGRPLAPRRRRRQLDHRRRPLPGPAPAGPGRRAGSGRPQRLVGRPRGRLGGLLRATHGRRRRRHRGEGGGRASRRRPAADPPQGRPPREHHLDGRGVRRGGAPEVRAHPRRRPQPLRPPRPAGARPPGTRRRAHLPHRPAGHRPAHRPRGRDGHRAHRAPAPRACPPSAR